jgi:hypothetical protein
MRLLFLLVLCSCKQPIDTGGAPVPGETGETGELRDCAPADSDPEPTREGHSADGWRWQKHGALFADGEPLDYGDGDLAPTLVDTGAGLHLLFTRQRGLEQELWASTSSDGETWSEPALSTGLEAGSTDYTGLLFDDGRFRLWYGSGSIDYAESDDGVSFEHQGTVLRTGDDGDFDSLSLLYPGPARRGEDIVLAYTGFDGAYYAIGSASSADDGVTWRRDGLLLERDPEGWDNKAVAQPMLAYDDDGAWLWYGGYDISVSNPGPYRIGLARLDAAGAVERVGVSLPLAESGPDAWSTRDPAVLPWGDGWLMVYAGMGDDGSYRLMRASSDVCS